MDWITVAASAVVSTAISTGVGLATVSLSTVGQMRAQERERARQEIVGIAKDLQRKLLIHQDARSPKGQREADTLAMDDLSTAWKIVQPAQRLGWIRRRWTMALARRIFGPWTVDRATLMKDSSGAAAFTAWAFAAANDMEPPAITGSWHKALTSKSSSPSVEHGIRDIRLLEL